MNNELTKEIKRVTNYKLAQAAADKQDFRYNGQLFDVYATDTRYKPVESLWIIQPSLTYDEAVASAKMHAKQTANSVAHTTLHDDPPCLSPQFLCACIFVLVPDKEAHLISFNLREAGI